MKDRAGALGVSAQAVANEARAAIHGVTGMGLRKAQKRRKQRHRYKPIS